MYFENKVVWITGASSGLGEALAVELAKQKSKLVLSARRESELERVKGDCSKFISAENILILPLDVTELSNVKAEVQKVISKFGRIDMLINNAGVVQRSYVDDTPIELERKMFEINYFGAVILSKAVLPFMQKQKCGNILAVSSVMGKLGFPGRSTYSASKHALYGYFETMRIEERQNGIIVQMICPGYIKTNVSLNAMTASGKTHGKMDKGQEKGIAPEAAARKIMKAIPSGRFDIIFGGKELIAITAKRLWPSLFYKLILRAGKPKF